MSTELIEANGTRAAVVPCSGDEWLAMRSKGLGGSDAASVLGLSPWRSNVQLYLEKRGLVKSQAENEPMYWGKAVEPVIRQRYCDLTRRTVSTPAGILVHPEHSWMLASVDGVTDDGRLLEIKTARSGDAWGADGSDEIPVYYLCQIQHYLAVTGLEVADVAVLIGGQEYRQYEITADATIIESMIEQEAEFWHAVTEGIEPEVRTIEDAKALYRNAVPKIAQAWPEDRETATRIQQIKAAIDLLENEQNELTASLLRRMGEADTLAAGDAVLATWKQVKGRTSLDADRLKKELPEVYSQFLKTGESTRRFLLKGNA